MAKGMSNVELIAQFLLDQLAAVSMRYGPRIAPG
jgi:hypothetical protein